MYLKYCKIPIISPRLVFVQKAVLLGLFSGELILGGAYHWKEFCISKWVGLDNKTATACSTNSPLAYIWEGSLLEGFLCLRFGVLFSGGLIFFFWGGGGLIIGILRYYVWNLCIFLEFYSIVE